jgi:hypothetical protein
VSNLIHKHACANNLFLHAKRLGSEFLADIQLHVRDLEVRDRTAHEWEECIIATYSVYRKLLENNGGTVDIDFSTGTLEFRARAA